MKVTGKQTIVRAVDVELNDAGIKTVVYGQTADYLVAAIQEKLLYTFLHSLPPEFAGKRTVRESYRSGNKGRLVLIHVDADWDYHNNVGVDEEVRPLTEEETVKYNMICGLPDYIKKLKI